LWPWRWSSPPVWGKLALFSRRQNPHDSLLTRLLTAGYPSSGPFPNWLCFARSGPPASRPSSPELASFGTTGQADGRIGFVRTGPPARLRTPPARRSIPPA
jgi:hypothetical protein